MTPAERQCAASVMASEGPWQYRKRRSPLDTPEPWFDCVDDPEFDWYMKQYRVKPKSIVRYLNLYHNTHGFISRAEADVNSMRSRIACVRVEFTEGQFDD